jgi:hypothetical protein
VERLANMASRISTIGVLVKERPCGEKEQSSASQQRQRSALADSAEYRPQRTHKVTL